MTSIYIKRRTTWTTYNLNVRPTTTYVDSQTQWSTAAKNSAIVNDSR